MSVVDSMENYRSELVAYCYRYFGCYSEAKDAVQETFVRAWKNTDTFEERSSLRRWLYAIATNICLDMKKAAQRRYLPIDFSAAGEVPTNPSKLNVLPEATWITPLNDSFCAEDPGEAAVLRDSVRLAFIATLQLLPPRQRVTLILRDVLAWSAQECADLLGTTVASVNSALARARNTISSHDRNCAEPYDEILLMNYVSAFEAYDVEKLVDLLSDDAKFSMPPYELWLQGKKSIENWWRGPGLVCQGSRTIITSANSQPAVAVYHHVAPGRWEPFAIHVLDIIGDKIAGITHFLGSAVFGEFGLPKQVAEAVET